MKKILRYLNEKQLRVQSVVLWGIALFNFTSPTFWVFAIPAISASGMQDILEEIRKLTNNDTGPNF
jgi:hypothetical protein